MINICFVSYYVHLVGVKEETDCKNVLSGMLQNKYVPRHTHTCSDAPCLLPSVAIVNLTAFSFDSIVHAELSPCRSVRFLRMATEGSSVSASCTFIASLVTDLSSSKPNGVCLATLNDYYLWYSVIK